MNQMQCGGRKKRSTMDNIIIMSTIIDKKKTELFHDAYLLQKQLNALTNCVLKITSQNSRN